VPITSGISINKAKRDQKSCDIEPSALARAAGDGLIACGLGRAIGRFGIRISFARGAETGAAVATGATLTAAPPPGRLKKDTNCCSS
jgi:hypothetical protein